MLSANEKRPVMVGEELGAPVEEAMTRVGSVSSSRLLIPLSSIRGSPCRVTSSCVPVT
jgi:hypothetical protein